MASCGTGSGNITLPGDPSGDSILSAAPAFGGIDVSWTYPNLNPQGIAFTILYRSTNIDPLTMVEHRRVDGNYFFDKTTTETLITYYYWISHISINGTTGPLIGPASAMAKPLLEDFLELISGQITQSHLGQSLMTQLDRITLIEAATAQEVTDRVYENSLIGQQIGAIETDLEGVGVLLQEEITQRQTDYSAMVQMINQIDVGSGGGIASLTEEVNLLADEVSSQGQVLTQLQANFDDPITGLVATYADLQNEKLVRADADTAITQVTDQLTSIVNDPTTGLVATAARITSEEQTRASEDQALSQAITTLQAEVQDPTTGLVAAFAAISSEASTRATEDQALSTAIDTLESVVLDPTTGLAATYAALTSEINTRASEDQALVNAIDTLEASVFDPSTGLAAVNAIVQSEQQARVDADNALAQDITTVQTTINNPNTGLGAVYDMVSGSVTNTVSSTPPASPAINDIWVDSDDANRVYRWSGSVWVDITNTSIGIALQTALSTSAVSGANKIFFQSTTPTANAVGDMWFNTGSGDTPYRWSGSAWVPVNIATTSQVASQIYINNRTMVGYCEVGGSPNSNYESPAACQAVGGTWITGAPIAHSVKTVAVDDGRGNFVGIEQAFQSHANDIDDLLAEYTVKLDVNGYVAGFGITNDGATSQAIFNVDNFAIGKLGTTTILPFIVQGGQTYINDAYINKLTFDKLRATDGSFIVQNGKVKADYLEAVDIEVDTVTSTNYSPASAGFKLNGATGAAEFHAITIYDGQGNIALQSGQTKINHGDNFIQNGLMFNPNMLIETDVQTTPNGQYTKPAGWHVGRDINNTNQILEYHQTFYSQGQRVAKLLANASTTYFNRPAFAIRNMKKVRFKMRVRSDGNTSLMQARLYFTTANYLPQGVQYISYNRTDAISIPGSNYVQVLSQEAFPSSWTEREAVVDIPSGATFASIILLVSPGDQIYVDYIDAFEDFGDLASIDQVTGTYIANLAVDTAHIKDLAVGTLKVQDEAITVLEFYSLSSQNYTSNVTNSTWFSFVFNHGHNQTIPVLFTLSGSALISAAINGKVSIEITGGGVTKQILILGNYTGYSTTTAHGERKVVLQIPTGNQTITLKNTVTGLGSSLTITAADLEVMAIKK